MVTVEGLLVLAFLQFCTVKVHFLCSLGKNDDLKAFLLNKSAYFYFIM